MKFCPALQTDLLHDAFLVIVAQRSAQLVIVHGWTVLLDPPQPGHLQIKHQTVAESVNPAQGKRILSSCFSFHGWYHGTDKYFSNRLIKNLAAFKHE